MSITNSLRGSCMCGKIKYTMSGDAINTALCFCNTCRKSTGSVGMANSWFRLDQVETTQGKEHLKTYIDRSPDSGGMIERRFCGECGSPMFAENKGKFPNAVIVTMGTMDFQEPTKDWQPNLEYFCKRKAEWFNTPQDTEKIWEL